MKNWIPVVGVVLLLVTSGYWLAIRPGTVGAATAPAYSATVTASDSSTASNTPTSSAASATVTSAAKRSTNNSSTTQSTTSTPDRPDASPTNSLTRALDPTPNVQINERKWAVLGTREVEQSNGQQTVLVLRDEASGQLVYRQSALRFVLQPGEDYEAFIRERRNAQRLFVNVLYGEIALDAAAIALEYTALTSDKRVVKVQFIPLVVPINPR